MFETDGIPLLGVLVGTMILSEKAVIQLFVS